MWPHDPELGGRVRTGRSGMFVIAVPSGQVWTSNQTPSRGRAHRRGPPSEWLVWPPAQAPGRPRRPSHQGHAAREAPGCCRGPGRGRLLATQDDQADPSRGRGGVRERIGDQLASQQDHDLDQDVEPPAVQGRLDEPPGRQTAASRPKVVLSPSSVAPSSTPRRGAPGDRRTLARPWVGVPQYARKAHGAPRPPRQRVPPPP
jgi:hypothetical protein